MQIVLASQSPYRHQLLEKLGVNFTALAPSIDESHEPGEPPEQLVIRLAQQKAEAVARDYPNALVIGSDQVGMLNHEILTKPANHKQAVSQLKRSSGKQVIFFTSLCLINTQTGTRRTCVDQTTVNFLDLSDDEIEAYLIREQPYDCAGSFKVEGLGIALFSSIESLDPYSLIGLPLIRLVQFLKEEGVNVLLSPTS